MIMKKPNRFCIVITTIILLFLVSCVDRTGKYIFYQFKNETGEDLKLKFYYTHKSIAPAYDSLMIRTGEYSSLFWEISGGADADVFFIVTSDSIDFSSNNQLKKRYKRSDGVGSKTPYSTDYFDQKNIGTKGETINVYTILPEDFIAK